MDMETLERLAGPTTSRDICSWAGNLLRRARTNAALSQRALAELADVPQSTVARIESGAMQPTLPMISQLLIAMGKELRIRVEDFDDHDRVLDERAVQAPERQARMERARDQLLDAVREHPSVGSVAR